MTRTTNYADNWRDNQTYEVAIVNVAKHLPTIQVEWLEGPDVEHREWLHKDKVQLNIEVER